MKADNLRLKNTIGYISQSGNGNEKLGTFLYIFRYLLAVFLDQFNKCIAHSYFALLNPFMM